MGFVFGCALFACVVWLLWRLVVSSEERKSFSAQFAEKPLRMTAIILWIGSTLTFFVGIFAPVVGEIRVGDTGLEVWQAAGLIAVAGFVISIAISDRR